MNTPEKPAATLGKFARARGGRELVSFKDVLGNACKLETVPFAYGNGSLRLGVEKARPMIQALDARALGLTTNQKTGLVKYEIPPEVRIDTQMVLARNQVHDLVQLLVNWLKHSSLEVVASSSVIISPEPPPAAAEPKDDALGQLEAELEKEKPKPKAVPPTAPAKPTDDEQGDDPAEDPHTVEQIASAAFAARKTKVAPRKAPAQPEPTDEELAREEAAEYSLNAMLERDGIPYDAREAYQERRRKGERYVPKSRGEMVE